MSLSRQSLALVLTMKKQQKSYKLTKPRQLILPNHIHQHNINEQRLHTPRPHFGAFCPTWPRNGSGLFYRCTLPCKMKNNFQMCTG